MHSDNKPLYYPHDNQDVVAAIEVARTQHKKRVTVDYAEDGFQANLGARANKYESAGGGDTGWIRCWRSDRARPELQDSVRSRTEVGTKPLYIEHVVRVRVGNLVLWQHPNYHEHEYDVNVYSCPVCLAILATQQPV